MSFYDFKINKPSGEKIDLNNFKGKVILVVNTATKCGLAPQFKGLEDLHKKYKDKGLVLLGFPCSQFLNQEPVSNESMKDVCESDYGVTFQLTEKIDVNGSNAHQIFKHLKTKKGGILGNSIKWNFTKFLISREGKVVKRYSPTTRPENMEADLEHLLSKS
jgi:glutathione peroxidase